MNENIKKQYKSILAKNESWRHKNIKALSFKLLSMILRELRISFPLKVKVFWGDEMKIIIPEEVSFKIFRDRIYEPGVTKMFLEFVKLNMIVIDIGAHYGYFSLLSSSLVGNNGHVIAFEPTPATFDILQSNLKKKQNITLYNKAVYSYSTQLRMHDFGTEMSAYNSFTVDRLNRLDKRHRKIIRNNFFEVSAVSIDDFVLNNSIEPNFIKIDAEFAEFQIIKGMLNTIDKFHPIITVEVGDIKNPTSGRYISSSELILYLLRLGYKAFEYQDKDIVPHKLKEWYEYDNVLLLPR